MLEKIFRFFDGPEENPARPENVFGGYDIRGRYPQEINEEFFRALAGVISGSQKINRVAIGRDSRHSSASLELALGESFRERGVNVIDLGLITTPYGAWVARTKRLDTFIVTASHNPSGENGLKIYTRNGEAVTGKELKALHEAFVRARGAPLPAAKYGLPAGRQGSLTSADFTDQYQKYLLRVVGLFPVRTRVALDYMHGTVRRALAGILAQEKIDFATLREDPSGDFPAPGPNPLNPENQKELSFMIRHGRYRLGAIFDGDADRVIFLDETGATIPTPRIAALICDYLFSKKGVHRTIVVPVNFSRIIDDVVQAKKGRVYRSSVGRVNLTPLMRAHRASFGVEASGHYFFKDFFYQDNAVLAFLYVLKILGEHKGTKLSELIAPYKKYATLPEENIPYVSGTEGEVLKAVRASFPGGKIDRTDGLTVHYRDWWFNLRRSSTEALWRVSVEATDLPAGQAGPAYRQAGESLAREKLEAIKRIVGDVRLRSTPAGPSVSARSF